MKRTILISLMTLLAITVSGKDIKTVVFTTTPQMHCESCETKIKNGVRFVRGVKSIETNVDSQAVTIRYDADKTTTEKIRDGFAKIGYKVRELMEGEKAVRTEGEDCPNM